MTFHAAPTLAELAALMIEQATRLEESNAYLIGANAELSRQLNACFRVLERHGLTKEATAEMNKP